MPTVVSSIFAFCLLVASQVGCPGALGQTATDKRPAPNGSKVNCTDNNPLAKQLPPAGPACEQELLARRGRPFMFPAHNGVAFGVSSEPDKPSLLHLWVDNQTDKSETFYVCCALTLFAHIDIFDSQGHRILSKADQRGLKSCREGCKIVEGCDCSGSATVPPHTIEMLDSADVSVGYDIPPGRFVISARNPPGLCNGDVDKYEGSPHAPPGLVISVP